MSNIKTGEKQGCFIEISFSVPLVEMDKYLNSASDKLSQDMSIKGFRDGKIPRKIVEQSVGAETLWREASGYAVDDEYWQAIEKEKLEPIGMPKIEILKLVPGNDFEFKALVPVMPNLQLPDYKEIAQKIIKPETKEQIVDAKEIEESLQWLSRSRTKVPNKDKKEPESPKIDDEFAKSLGNFENLDALKASLKKGLVEEKQNQQKQKTRLLIIEKIIREINLDIPDFLMEQEIDRMQSDLERQASSMEMTLEDYLKKAKKSIKEVRDGWRQKAHERIMAGIILKAIAKAENIEPDENELEQEVSKYIKQFQGAENLKSLPDPEHVKAHIRGIMRNEKVFEFLEAS